MNKPAIWFYAVALTFAFGCAPADSEGGEGASLCDRDGDGFTNAICGGDDCNDDDPEINPDAKEKCDRVDRNCDGKIHEGATDFVTLYYDEDQDGYGTPNATVEACAPYWPFVDNSDDCDDSNPKLNPGVAWYQDSDGDGYGNEDVSTTGCDQPEGYVANSNDPDDSSFDASNCWKEVAIGRDHSCGLTKEDDVVCWGSNIDGQTNSPSGKFVQISSGYKHVCARNAAGNVQCWGAVTDGATAAPMTEVFHDLSCGLNFCCGILATARDHASAESGSDGGIADEVAQTNLLCWGDNGKGQASPPAGIFAQVSASGDRHACGVLEDGTTLCWGENDNGETDVPVGETFVEVSAAHKYNCGLKEDGTVLCWGNNQYGQGTPPEGETFTHVNSTTVHSCGLTTEKEIKCWGSASFGRTAAPEGNRYERLDAEQLHSCAIDDEGNVTCWGHDESDRLTPALCPL